MTHPRIIVPSGLFLWGVQPPVFFWGFYTRWYNHPFFSGGCTTGYTTPDFHSHFRVVQPTIQASEHTQTAHNTNNDVINKCLLLSRQSTAEPCNMLTIVSNCCIIGRLPFVFGAIQKVSRIAFCKAKVTVIMPMVKAQFTLRLFLF